MRIWLNGEFLSTAFNAEEQLYILPTELTEDDDPASGTEPIRGQVKRTDVEDRIFLLSYEEAKQYFPDDASRRCEATEYARAKGVFVAHNGNSLWWLRSSGSGKSSAACINANGQFHYKGNSVDGSGVVRPAFWVNCS